jgi:predicted TIM-barrel fold metal-dependent hydrolase
MEMSEATTSTGPIIDVHAHALLPVWVGAMQKLFGDRPISIGGTPVPDWSVQGHLAVMDENQIATSILSWPGAASFLKGQAAKDLARAMNEEFAATVSQHPSRFGAFAVVPVDDIDLALDEIAYALDVLKLDGLALTTNAGGHYLGDAYFEPLLAEMHRRGATLFVHPGVPPGFDLAANGLNVAILEFMFDSTRMATNMVLSGAKAKFDRINIICTHGGGTLPYLAHRIGRLEPLFGAGHGRPTATRQEIFDGLASFYYDLTAATHPAQLDAMRRLVPATRLLMGFDYPMMPATEIEPSKALFAAYDGMTSEDKSLITRGNAAQLFPRLKALELA